MSSKRKTPSVAIAREENNTVRSKRVKRKTEFYAKSSVNFKANGVLKSVKSTASADLIDLTDDRISYSLPDVSHAAAPPVLDSCSLQDRSLAVVEFDKNSLLLFDYERCAVPPALGSYSLPDRSLAAFEFDKDSLLLFDYERCAVPPALGSYSLPDRSLAAFEFDKDSLLLFDYERYVVPPALGSYSLPDRSLARCRWIWKGFIFSTKCLTRCCSTCSGLMFLIRLRA
jgi:hypothetical protein